MNGTVSIQLWNWHKSTADWRVPKWKMKHFNFWITALPLYICFYCLGIFYREMWLLFGLNGNLKKKNSSLFSGENKRHHHDACDGDHLLSILPCWISSRCDEKREAIISHFKAARLPRGSSAVFFLARQILLTIVQSHVDQKRTNRWGHHSC